MGLKRQYVPVWDTHNSPKGRSNLLPLDSCAAPRCSLDSANQASKAQLSALFLELIVRILPKTMLKLSGSPYPTKLLLRNQ